MKKNLKFFAGFLVAPYVGAQGSPSTTNTSSSPPRDRVLLEEMSRGTQGPVNADVLEHLSRSSITGVEYPDNPYNCQLLIQHMLRPFSQRRNYTLPSYDASDHLESYFPVLFPYGKGGPTSTTPYLGTWVKHALSIYRSRFVQDVDFIFFVYSVLKRKRLSGLSSHAPIRRSSSNAIVEVRELLSSALPADLISSRIDRLLRSRVLNASFETLRRSPAFWAALKRTSWAYLIRFDPCQLFVTIIAADLIDPYVYCQIKSTMTIEEARSLSSRRTDFLASNPVAAVTIFHRRIQSILDNFLFGEV